MSLSTSDTLGAPTKLGLSQDIWPHPPKKVDSKNKTDPAIPPIDIADAI